MASRRARVAQRASGTLRLFAGTEAAVAFKLVELRKVELRGSVALSKEATSVNISTSYPLLWLPKEREGRHIDSLTRRHPISIDIVSLKLQRSNIARRRWSNSNAALREGVKGTPQIAILINTQTLRKPRQLREVISGRRDARNILLGLDPDIDRLDVGAGEDALLRGARRRDAVDLSHDAVVAGVAREDVSAVLELVLRVAAAAETDGGDDAVCHGACARVDVHGVEGDGGAGVRGIADDLRVYPY